jgi:hypothetical protein
MSIIVPNYEFQVCNCSFPNGNVNCIPICVPFSTMYSSCTLSDVSGTRQQIINNKIIELIEVMSRFKDLHSLSSFTIIDGYTYKITIHNKFFKMF